LLARHEKDGHLRHTSGKTGNGAEMDVPIWYVAVVAPIGLAAASAIASLAIGLDEARGASAGALAVLRVALMVACTIGVMLVLHLLGWLNPSSL
jgi:hypothetical protein